MEAWLCSRDDVIWGMVKKSQLIYDNGENRVGEQCQRQEGLDISDILRSCFYDSPRYPQKHGQHIPWKGLKSVHLT